MPKFRYIQSSSIVLQRTTQEVLVCKRSQIPSFFPNAYVFPGGKLKHSITNWNGDEDCAKNTALQELFEETGLIPGNKGTIPPKKRKGSWQLQIKSNKTTQKLLEMIIFAGRRQSPPFGRVCYDAAFFYLSDDSLQFQKGAPDGEEIVETEWIKPEVMISRFLRNEATIPPPVLYICKLLKISANHWINTSRKQTNDAPGLQTPIELARNFEAVPLFSNTAPPYFTTTLGILSGKDKVLYIDPGWNSAASQIKKLLLKDKTKERCIFLTHHHNDHIAGLSKIAELFPDAVVYAHKFTLERVNTDLQTKEVKEASFSLDDEWEVELVYAPGHTEGHMVLFDKRSRIIYAGDHVVDAGAVVLDPHSGNMSDYFQTLDKLEKLESNLLIPSHGRPSYKPAKLLNYARAHRTKRELQILNAVKSGKASVNEILKLVYVDVPYALLKYAKLNIQHHLVKLIDERKIYQVDEKYFQQ